MLMLMWGILFIMFALEIIFLVKAIRKSEERTWKILIIVSIMFVILTKLTNILFELTSTNSNDMFSGLNSLENTLLYLVFIVLSTVMLYIVISTKIIKYEKKQKESGKYNKHPVYLMFAILCVFISTIFFTIEFEKNYGKIETTGKILDFTINKRYDFYNLEIEFNIDGKRYVSEDISFYEPKDVGQKVEITCKKNKDNNYIIVPSKSNYKYIYIPSLIVGILMIMFRFKNRSEREN